MPAQTPNTGYPYPLETDPIDVNGDIQRLAEAIDSGVGLLGQMLVGVIFPFAADTPPDGFLPCNGAAVDRVQYADLYAVIGDRWGAGDGSTTFNVPNLMGATLFARDGTAEFSTVAQRGGERKHTLIIQEMPAHGHGNMTGASDRSLNHLHTVNFWSGWQATNYADPHHVHPADAGYQFVEQTGPGGGALGFQFAASGDRNIVQRTSTLNESPGEHHHYVSGYTDGNQGAVDHLHPISIDGNNWAHNVLNPYVVVNYIIKH